MSLFVLNQSDLNNLIANLTKDGYQVIGPVIRDGVIFLEPISDLKHHPVGMRDVQAPGKYSASRINESRLFGFNNGPDSWKKYLFPPEQTLFRSRKNSEGKLIFEIEKSEKNKFAFLGVRACELSAITIHDAVFRDGKYSDKNYSDIRNNAFFIAVNCTVSADTCFCASMNTGPAVENNFDIVLTEIMDGKNPVLTGKSGSDRGKAVLEKLSLQKAADDIIRKCDKEIQAVRYAQKRRIDLNAVRGLLKININSNLFNKISEKCMSCTNCTLVCPTCFCYNVEDTSDITGDTAYRVRKWDSCFRENFSAIHGGKIRGSRKSRYRQWLSHKLTNWFDQFGSSGCVGCGRCISWCPAGIDITESAAAFTATGDTH